MFCHKFGDTVQSFTTPSFAPYSTLSGIFILLLKTYYYCKIAGKRLRNSRPLRHRSKCARQAWCYKSTSHNRASGPKQMWHVIFCWHFTKSVVGSTCPTQPTFGSSHVFVLNRTERWFQFTPNIAVHTLPRKK